MIDSRVAAVQALVKKLPELKVVAPASLAARSASRSISRSSRAVDAGLFTVFPPETPSYNTSSRLWGMNNLKDGLDTSLWAKNLIIDALKLYIEYDGLSFESPLFKSGANSDDTERWFRSMKLSELEAGGYRISITDLEVTKDGTTGPWGSPSCNWSIYDLSENEIGQVKMDVWNARRAASAVSGDSVDSSTFTYADTDYDYFHYDESSGTLFVFLPGSVSASDYYWKAVTTGDEREVFCQIKENLTEAEQYSDTFYYMWGDDTDGIIADYSRRNTSGTTSSMAEDYLTDLSGNPATFIGGKRNNDYVNGSDYETLLSNAVYEWPLDLLEVADSTKQLVRYLDGSSYSFYLTDAGVDHTTFNPLDYTAFGVESVIFPSSSVNSDTLGGLTKVSVFDPANSTSTDLYCYCDDRADTSFQPAHTFVIDDGIAQKAAVISTKAEGWVNHAVAMDGVKASARLDLGLMPTITIDLSTLESN